MKYKQYKLCDICDVKIGRTPPRNEPKWFCHVEDGIKWVSIKDLGQCNKFIYETSEGITKSGQERFSIPIVKAGTVLLSFKLTIGRVAIATEDLLTNEAIAQLPIIDTSVVDRDYLYYYLSNFKWSQLGNTSSIATAINSKIIKNMIIELPPIDVQKKVANILNSLDELINNNNSINNNLLEQAQNIFEKEFLCIESLPTGWEISNLLGIADYLNGLAMQKFRPVDDEIGLPVLKIKELRQGFCDSNSEYCSPSIKPEYIVHDGDVIFSWSGSLLVDFWCGNTCGLNQHLFKVSSNKYDKWFYYAWTNHHLEKFAAIAADMATTMGHIKREELEKAEVVIPSNEDYERIGSLLAPIYDLVVSNRIENRKLSQFRDELLPKLMSGKLDVSEVSL